MSAALRLLFWLRARGMVRMLWRRLHTVRGWLLLLFWLLLLAMVSAGEIIRSFSNRGLRASPESILLVMPVLLLILCLLSLVAGRKVALIFSAAELQHLFAGPFSRRSILAHRLAGQLVPMVFLSGYLALMLRNSVSFGAAWLALMLALAFVHTLNLGLQLTGLSTLRSRRPTLVALPAVVVACLVVAALLEAAQRFDRGALATLLAFGRSWGGAALLAPFRVFARLAVARGPGELAGWSSAALGMTAASTWFVLASDASYEDAALAASRVQHARLERMRQGGLSIHRSKVSRSSTWNLPRLGGVGPVAWVELIRLGRLSLPVKAFALLTPMALAWFIVRSERRDPRAAIAFVTMLVSYMALVSSPMYGSSLRGAPPLMAKLKALPLSPTALVAGLMLPGVAVLTSLHALAYAVCVAVRPSLWPWAATGLAFSLVFNGLLLALEDWASLQVPSPDDNSDGVRAVASRTVFLGVLKMIGTAVAAGVASGVGILTGWLSHSLEWGLMAGWAALALQWCVAVLMVGRSFRRFDPDRAYR